MNIAKALALHSELDAVSESARLDAEMLLAHVLKKDRVYLFAWPEKILSDEQITRYHALLQRRKKGEPIAYIVGEKAFWNLDLYVDASTLIPRPDTETLVELALSHLPLHREHTVLDLGTGSGAIALALASERPQITVYAVDRAKEAVTLAQKNQQRYGLTNVEILQGSWFEPVSAGCFDMIVSNPPYIDAEDPHLAHGDVRFEPSSALIAKNKGLACIETILKQAPFYLKRQGWLCFEHGWQQAKKVRELFLDARFDNVTSHKDLSGNDRVTIGCWSGANEK